MSCGWSFVQHYERIEPDYKYSLLFNGSHAEVLTLIQIQSAISLRGRLWTLKMAKLTMGIQATRHSAKWIDS